MNFTILIDNIYYLLQKKTKRKKNTYLCINEIIIYPPIIKKIIFSYIYKIIIFLYLYTLNYSMYINIRKLCVTYEFYYIKR